MGVGRLDQMVGQSSAEGPHRLVAHYSRHALAWCSNVGDNLAVMLHPGSAGSFTAADHVAVLDAAVAQISAVWRDDLLVTVDGPGSPTP